MPADFLLTKGAFVRMRRCRFKLPVASSGWNSNQNKDVASNGGCSFDRRHGRDRSTYSEQQPRAASHSFHTRSNQHNNHSGIQMENCHSPSGQSWPWEPVERQMRLICVFYAFPNECLTQETRWGAEEGHKQGGCVCEILWVWDFAPWVVAS